MKFAHYPEYSPTGIGWLDDAPSHWKSVPIKQVALEQHSLFLDGDWIESRDLADAGIRYLTTGNVGEGRFKEQGSGFISGKKFKELKCTEVFPGDILVSRLNRPIGRSCIVPDLGFRIVTSVDNVIVRADSKYLRPFLVYLFSSKDYFRHTDNLARGTTMHRISRGLLGNIRIIVPPLVEQTQIAKFLDYETAKIDALIEKQQQLIALLKEKLQAVISHAVTKGLNPDAPMRASGVEWIEIIPSQWGSSRLGFECSVKARLGWKGLKADEYVESGCIFLATPNIKGKEIDFEDVNYITRQRYDESPEIILEVGDVLVTKDGSTTGTTNVVRHLPGPTTVNSSIAVMRSYGRLDCEYLFYFFTSEYVQHVINRVRGGMGVPHLFQADLRKFFVPVPPIEEQIQIAELLGNEMAKMDALIEKASDLAVGLQERRTALISAAVTGKIDVRNWKAPKTQTQTETA